MNFNRQMRQLAHLVSLLNDGPHGLKFLPHRHSGKRSQFFQPLVQHQEENPTTSVGIQPSPSQSPEQPVSEEEYGYDSWGLPVPNPSTLQDQRKARHYLEVLAGAVNADNWKWARAKIEAVREAVRSLIAQEMLDVRRKANKEIRLLKARLTEARSRREPPGPRITRGA